MTREKQTVWKDKEGNQILRTESDGTFYTPLGTMNTDTMRELGNAIIDALSNPPTPEGKAE
jgi:hypothetical protein